MDVGGAQVVVAMAAMTVLVIMVVVMIVVVVMAMPVAMTTVVVPPAGQKDGADQIDHETQDGDQRRLAEGDRARIDQAADGLSRDPERHDAQNQRRGEPRQVPDLAGPEAEAPVGGMPLGVGVGAGRNGQGAGVGRQVKAVGQQGHRAVDQAGDDLPDHHDGRQADHPQRSPCAVVVRTAEEIVVVGQIVGLGRGHGAGLTLNSGE